MAINFPVSLDDLANVGTGDTITPAHKNDLNDIVEALEAKVGIDSSAVATSHDYLLTHLPSQAQGWDIGAFEIRAQTFQSDIVTGTAPFTIASTTVSTNLNADLLDGNHAAAFQTVLTNSAGLAAAVSDETGTGVVVFSTSPTLVTPVLGVATATSINGLTIDTTTGTLDITNAKTLTVTGDVTLSGTPYMPGGTDVALTDGGTGQSTAQAAINALAGGVTANKVLRGDGSNILLAAVNMASDVTGTLALGNGGTGATSLATARTALGITADRGDPAAVDFAVGDLTTDGTWRDLDLSGVVPAGAILVVLSVLITSSVGTDKISFRKNGNSNAVNIGTVIAQNLGTNAGDIIVACDTNRVIEYATTNSAHFTVINITVKGWSF